MKYALYKKWTSLLPRRFFAYMNLHEIVPPFNRTIFSVQFSFSSTTYFQFLNQYKYNVSKGRHKMQEIGGTGCVRECPFKGHCVNFFAKHVRYQEISFIPACHLCGTQLESWHHSRAGGSSFQSLPDCIWFS